MTPAPGQPISLTDVLVELQRTNPARALPISLGDADVRALAGIPSGPISLGDCAGKSIAPGYTPMSGLFHDKEVFDAPNPPGNRTVNAAISVTINGGTAPITCVWSKLSGDGTLTSDSSTAANVAFVNTRFSPSGQVQRGEYRCVATDAANNTITLNGYAQLTLD